jgi:hypothetical protein
MQSLLVCKLYKAEWGEEWGPNPSMAPLPERVALLKAAEEVVDRLAAEVCVCGGVWGVTLHSREQPPGLKLPS